MKRFFAFFLGLLLTLYPFVVQAKEFESSIEPNEEIEIVEGTVEVPKPMTQKEIDELLGEDPYLGQTSWLGGKLEK